MQKERPSSQMLQNTKRAESTNVIKEEQEFEHVQRTEGRFVHVVQLGKRSEERPYFGDCFSKWSDNRDAVGHWSFSEHNQ